MSTPLLSINLVAQKRYLSNFSASLPASSAPAPQAKKLSLQEEMNKINLIYRKAIAKSLSNVTVQLQLIQLLDQLSSLSQKIVDSNTDPTDFSKEIQSLQENYDVEWTTHEQLAPCIKVLKNRMKILQTGDQPPPLDAEWWDQFKIVDES